MEASDKEIALDIPFSSRLNGLVRFFARHTCNTSCSLPGVLLYNRMFSRQFESEYL